MATTGPRVVKAALKTLLEAKSALDGVTIYTYTVSLESISTREYIVLGNVEGEANPDTMGGSVLSEYDIACTSRVHQPTTDGTADRGWEILDAVAEVAASDWTVTGLVLDLRLESFDLAESIDPSAGRVVDLDFILRVRDLSA